MAVNRVNSRSAEARNENQKTVEEYRKRESQLKKTQQDELARIRKDNEKRMKALQQEHREQIEAFRQTSQGKISEKDMRYQEEMKNIKNLHRQQMAKLQAENERREAYLRARGNDQLQRITDSKDEQYHDMKTNYETYISNQKKEFNKSLNETRENAQSSTDREKNQLIEANEKDRVAREKYFRDELIQKEREKQRIRKEKDFQIQDLKSQKEDIKQDLTSKYTGEIKNLQKTYGNRLDQQREAFNLGLEEVRQEKVDTVVEKNDQFQNALHNLRTDVNRRHKTHTDVLERRLADTKSQGIEDRVKIQHANRIEKEKLIDQIRHRQDVMQEQRDAAIQDANRKNQKVMTDLIKENNSRMENTERDYRNKMVTQEMIKEENTRQIKDELESRLRRSEIQSKQTNLKIKNRMEIEKRDLEERFKAMIEQMKFNHQQQIQDLKTQTVKERNEIIANYQSQLKSNEMKHAETLAETIRKYEDRITELQSKAKSDKIRDREISEQRLKDQERNYQMKFQTQEIQHKNQISQVKERYDHQVETQRKRIEKMQADMIKGKS